MKYEEKTTKDYYERSGQQMGADVQNQCPVASTDDPNEYRLNHLKDRLRYHAPFPDQQRRYQNLRDAALAFATVIVRNTPDNNDTSNALNALEATLMLANKAIALENVPLS